MSQSHLPPESISKPCKTHKAHNAMSKDGIKRDKHTSKCSPELHSPSTSCSPLTAPSTQSISLSIPTAPYLDPVSQQPLVGQSSKSESVEVKSGEGWRDQSLEFQRPVLVLLPDVTKQPLPILDNEDLPEFDFGTSCGSVSQVVVNKEIDSLTIDRKLPEKGFPNMNVSPPLVMPSIKSWPTAHHRGLESINHQGLSSDEIKEMPPQKKVCRHGNIPMLTAVVDKQNTGLRMPSITPAAQFVKNLFNDDDDMPEWCPPHVSVKKQSTPVTSQSSNFHIHSNKQNPVPPSISVAAPNRFPSSASMATDHPVFSAEASHFSVHPPGFAVKEGQARPTNMYMVEKPSYPPPRQDSCVVKGKMPSSGTWKGCKQ